MAELLIPTREREAEDEMTSVEIAGGDLVKERFDRYSVGETEFLAAGGAPAAVRHDPYEGIDPTLPGNKGWVGHADCAREWDPCQCHGDRLCQLGRTIRWMGQIGREYDEGDAARAVAIAAEALAPSKRSWPGLGSSVRSDGRLLREMARDAWPWLVANARQDRVGTLYESNVDEVVTRYQGEGR